MIPSDILASASLMRVSGAAQRAWPIAAQAQQRKLPTIGFVSSSKLQSYPQSLAVFHRGLRETGYVEGQNVAVEYRVADDHVDRLPGLVADLIRRGVAVIATASSVSPALAAKTATSTISIVFVMGADPVENNLVVSLARPGGNMTGVTVIAEDLFKKRLGLLHELVPAAGLIAYLANPTNLAYAKFAPKVLPMARTVGVEMLELNDALFMAHREELVTLAARHLAPASYFRREFAEIGGLTSYGAKIDDAYCQAGVYVGRILNGEMPSDLPVLQPTKFEMVINLKSAEALGLTIPPTLLTRADEVIE